MATNLAILKEIGYISHKTITLTKLFFGAERLFFVLKRILHKDFAMKPEGLMKEAFWRGWKVSKIWLPKENE
jgi:hypothetical protein